MWRWIDICAYGLAALGAISLLAAAIAWWRRPEGPLCPGPARRWWHVLSPGRWLDPPCGYWLAGLPSAPDGSMRCPECGSVSTARDLRGLTPGTRRLLAASVLLALVSGLCWKARWIAVGGWTKYAPTPLLTVTARRIPAWTPPGVRPELRRRLERADLSEPQRHTLIIAAVANLGDDSAGWNAHWALGIVERAGDDALPMIERALGSRDYQRRQLAAHVLRKRWRRGAGLYPWLERLPAYTPTPELFRVTVEGLADDSLPHDRSRGIPRSTWVANAFDGLVFLVENPLSAGQYLGPALDSPDRQQRYLGAVASGMIGETRLLAKAAPILIEHLGENGVGGDAAVATRALYMFGPEVLPFIKPVIDSADRQAADLARLIAMDLEAPGRPLPLRRSLNKATTVVNDPATDMTLDRIRDALR